MTDSFHIAVFEGDGIGPEVTAPCLAVLDAAAARAGIALSYEPLAAGARAYLAEGTALPEVSLARARRADAILLSAMGDPAVRYPDGTELIPQVDLRLALGLYAGVRPVRTIPGVKVPLADPRAGRIDFVLVRESTEGLFASVGKGAVGPDEARETLVITRKGSQNVVRFALRLAEERHAAGHAGELVCVDKANVFSAFAFFRAIFDEETRHFPAIRTRRAYVDAMALEMLARPWQLDVLVTENMFGDILSDLGAGLMGGLGFAPSADIGDEYAVFQPCHGSAPDIAGKGLANPTAMFLSGAMMLEWLGARHDRPRASEAGRIVRAAVEAAFAGGDLRTRDQGGDAGTAVVAARVLEELRTVPERALA